MDREDLLDKIKALVSTDIIFQNVTRTVLDLISPYILVKMMRILLMVILLDGALCGVYLIQQYHCHNIYHSIYLGSFE
jgi:hypothetical protein